MYKVTGICVKNEKAFPKTIYCLDFADVLYGCVAADIDTKEHFLKIEYIDTTIKGEDWK